MKTRFYSKFAGAVFAALIVPALAFSQGPAPQAPDGPDGPGGFRTMSRGPWGAEGGEMRMHSEGRRGEGMELAWVVNDPKLREKLGITTEQAAKIRQEALDFEKAEIRLRADAQVKRLDLHSLVSVEKPDRTAIYRCLQEVSAAQLAIEKAGIDHHLATRDLLTPEQMEKLKQFRHEFGHHEERAPGSQMMMHPGGGMMMHPDAPDAPPSPAPQQ
jgi:Spy/CpxP family protein refolding chaperone